MFDWSSQTENIQWAAFYSDCEHEVLEVTSGHRITLTYNLYMRRGMGELTGHSKTLNAQHLPAYKEVESALASPEFMAEGKSRRLFPKVVLMLAQVVCSESTAITHMPTPPKVLPESFHPS